MARIETIAERRMIVRALGLLKSALNIEEGLEGIENNG